MATMTASELLDWLGKSLFLPAAQVEELRPTLPGYADGHALAKELIKRNWLTPYQVNQILQGKGDALIVGANRLLERIGEGAMGQVFRAWNTRLGRMVAVKMIHKEHIANSKAMDRFRREMETASQLDHPNIVLVRDAGEADGRPYLMMDYIDGIDLSQRVKQQGPLPLAEAVTYAHQAALGLQHAYERGVVHRDIKPGNLMLVTSSAGNAGTAHSSPLTPHQIKILDFGLARFDSEMGNANRLTHAGNLLGTVDYIAPEQAQDARSADTRADLYSLGCTLFYLLTGKPPFPGESVVDKVSARTTGEPPSVRAARNDVPIGLDMVVRRLMARQPADRFATPQEAAQALAPFMRLTAHEETTATLSQAELAAALAARKVAVAIPVTQPLPAGVPIVQALPVNPAAHAARLAGGDFVPVVQATPLTDTPPLLEAAPMDSGIATEHNPFQQGAAADPAPPYAMALPVATPLAGAAPGRNWMLLGGGAVAALALVVTLIIMFTRGGGASDSSKGYGPGAELRFLEVGGSEPGKLSPVPIREGRKTPVIVKIHRKDFNGPVKVRFEKLPDGFQSDEIVISEKSDMNQLYLMVSFGLGAVRADLRLVATAENLHDSAMFPVAVESKNTSTAPQAVPIDDGN